MQTPSPENCGILLGHTVLPLYEFVLLRGSAFGGDREVAERCSGKLKRKLETFKAASTVLFHPYLSDLIHRRRPAGFWSSVVRPIRGGRDFGLRFAVYSGSAFRNAVHRLPHLPGSRSVRRTSADIHGAAPPLADSHRGDNPPGGAGWSAGYRRILGGHLDILRRRGNGGVDIKESQGI
ncbi:MAG: hypothetical protein BJ554DRAFT_7007 [Olpidium bornovanus]|uniref:Uncharacterized protein n=1 Tax=Olpidium bornovanus TaxID=278681 RepID=A0A8H8A238_9FUNG|nr:MAG: hypothetical protein BJ554DRAFT_7007 [Olpidium bornovanus]